MLWTFSLHPGNAFCTGHGREQCLTESLDHPLCKHAALECETSHLCSGCWISDRDADRASIPSSCGEGRAEGSIHILPTLSSMRQDAGLVFSRLSFRRDSDSTRHKVLHMGNVTEYY